jgi:hypothetical protein
MARKTSPDGVLVIRVLFIALLLSAFLILFVLTSGTASLLILAAAWGGFP